MENRAENPVTQRALERAAKLICTLKCGVCPFREANFSGCPGPCTEEIRPWQCWVAHLTHLSLLPDQEKSETAH